MGRTGLLAALTAMGALLAAPVFAEEVIPAGPEFKVSRGHGYAHFSDYDGYVTNPDVARAPNGQFVVVWEEYVQGYQGYNYTSAYRLAARRMNRDGSGAGAQFKIFQVPYDDFAGLVFNPAIATTPDDGFVAVWGTGYDFGPEPDRIWVQRFDDTNTPLAPPFQVNQNQATVVAGHTRRDVATDSQGGFLVVWDTWGVDPNPEAGASIAARKFDANGVPVTPEFQVNAVSNGYYGYTAVSVDAQDEFVVAWSNISNDNPTTAPDGMFAQRLDVDGTPLGGQITVLAHDTPEESKNHVARGPAGNFMVVQYGYYQPYGGQTARVMDATGAPITGEFQVDPDGDYGTVAADVDGNFVVVWYRDEDELYGQRFSPTGVPLGAEFHVNEQEQYTSWNWPEIATDADGDFVVVWPNAQGWEDEELVGVRARRFAVCGNARVGPDDGCDDGNTDALDGCSATCKVETCHACSGDPSICTQFPGCTAACTNPAAIQPNTTTLSFKGLGAPLGDEGMTFKGKVANPPLAHLEYNPSADGIELALTTTGLVYGVFGPTALPPGPPGSGCDPNDGWKAKPGVYVYKNVSNALPPGCAPGSAGGVRVVKVKDKIDRDGTLQFRIKARNATIGTMPVPPLVATVVLGTSPGAGAAGRCGQITFTGAIGTRFFP